MSVFKSLQQAFRIGKITGNPNTMGNATTLQVALSDLERYNNMQLIQHYGFASVPTQGCNLGLTQRGGAINQATITSTHDARHYPSGMAAGETQIHDNAGQKVYLQGGVTITITANNQVVITAPNVICNATTGVTFNTPMLHVSGDISCDGNISAHLDVNAGVVSLKGHVHDEVMSGDDDTGLPVQ